MIFEKKYWSEGEYKTEDGKPYTGHVGILKGKGYIFHTEEPLVKEDSYIAQFNSTKYFTDRILDEDIALPFDYYDTSFAANDFLSSSVLRDIILKLQANNDYIFRNAIISNTMIPNTDNVSILATRDNTYFVFVGKSGKEYQSATTANLKDITDGFILNPNSPTTSADYPLAAGEAPKEKYPANYLRIPKTKAVTELKNGYLHRYDLTSKKKTSTALDNTFYPQFKGGKVNPATHNFNDLSHAEIAIKKVLKEGSRKKIELFIFLLLKTKLIIFPYTYYTGDLKTMPEVPDINFNTGSKDILILDTVEPMNKNSLAFLGLKDIEIHGNYMYLVDETLNMVLRYDISFLLNDESDLSFKLESIRLIDQLQGDGTARDEIYFNHPVSIAADDDYIYVADKGNGCIKKYSSSFDYVTTLQNGAFTNHSIESIAINPYAPTLEDGTVLEPGSLWIFSTSGKHLFITVISGGLVKSFKQVEKIELLEDEYTWDEEFKSVKFSFTNSNYAYLSTTKRVYKIHLSRPTYPFASLSYFKQRSLLSTMVWSSVPYHWHLLPDGTGDEDVNITWAYRPGKSSAEVLDNRAFCVVGIDTTEPVENDENEQQQFDGDLILHIGNLYNQSAVDTYCKRNNVKFGEIPDHELAPMVKCSGLFLYVEPTSYISSLSDYSVPCYISEDIKQIKYEEYINPQTFNSHIYKLIYNLINIKNALIGTFQGAYNIDNVMVFDMLILDDYFQQLKIENNDDLFVHENELTSIIINRIFEKIYDIQAHILDHMKTKFISTQSFNNNTFRII